MEKKPITNADEISTKEQLDQYDLKNTDILVLVEVYKKLGMGYQEVLTAKTVDDNVLTEIRLWYAVDYDGRDYLYAERKPTRMDKVWTGDIILKFPKAITALLPNMTWADEPILLELTFKQIEDEQTENDAGSVDADDTSSDELDERIHVREWISKPAK